MVVTQDHTVANPQGSGSPASAGGPTAKDDSHAVFFVNPAGRMIAVFSDAAFVRADALLVDPDGSVHVVLHEAAHPVGRVSQDLADQLVRHGEVLAAAVHAHGHVVDLPVPVCSGRGTTRH